MNLYLLTEIERGSHLAAQLKLRNAGSTQPLNQRAETNCQDSYPA